MSLFFLLALAFSAPSQAERPVATIVARLGNPDCSANVLLREYVITMNGLRKLKAQNAPAEEIAAYEMARDALAGGLIDQAKYWGMEVVANFTSVPKIIAPSIEIAKKAYPYAAVIGEGTQLKFVFTQLGICSFASPGNAFLGEQEILNAVGAMLE